MFDNQYLDALAIIIAFWLGSYVITIIISLFGRVASKTKSTLDDDIINAVKLPIRYLSVLAGLYYAVDFTGLDFYYKGITIENILYIFAVIIAGYAVSRLVKTFFDWYSTSDKETKKISKTMFVFLRKVISFSVYIVALIMILGHFGVEIRPLLAGLGVAGLAIALGLKETFANLFAALFIVLDKSVNIGDYIKLEDGTKACIEDISWRSVRIRETGGNTVIVPNSTFVGQNISSYDYPESPFYTSVEVGVSYDSDLEKVEKVSIRAGETVLKNEKIELEENNPVVRFNMLADSSINFNIILKVDKVKNESRIKHALIKEIIKEFRKENIDIPYPHVKIVK